MKLFVHSLQKLTKIIQNDPSLYEQTQSFVDLLTLSNTELEQIRKEVTSVELVDCDDFWDFTEEVYKSLMLKTIQLSLLQYFKTLEKDTSFLIEYTFVPWHRFKLTAKTVDQAEEKYIAVLQMKAKDIETQLQKLLDHFQIKDTKWLEDLYDFDYHFNFESEVETCFRELAFSCWKQAKADALGFISEANGGSYTYDLSSGKNLDEMNLSIQEYLDQSNSTKNR